MNLSSEEFEKETLEYQHLISQEDQDMVPFIQKSRSRYLSCRAFKPSLGEWTHTLSFSH